MIWFVVPTNLKFPFQKRKIGNQDLEQQFVELKKNKIAAEVVLAKAKAEAIDDQLMKELQKHKLESEIELNNTKILEAKKRIEKEEQLTPLLVQMQQAQLEMLKSQANLNLEQMKFYQNKMDPVQICRHASYH